MYEAAEKKKRERQDKIKHLPGTTSLMVPELLEGGIYHSKLDLNDCRSSRKKSSKVAIMFVERRSVGLCPSEPEPHHPRRYVGTVSGNRPLWTARFNGHMNGG